jgi:two-component system, NtrC family, response regulator AtoC
MKPVILVVDDEQAIRLFLQATLEDEGYSVVTFGTGAESLDWLSRTVPDLVLLDLMLPDMNGIQVLESLKEEYPHLPVVMITAYSQTDTAVQAMKLQAFDYVSKPIELDQLLKVVAKGLDETVEIRERFQHTSQIDLFRGVSDVVPSQSPEMHEIYQTVRKICGGDAATVLIEGESGVGKDVIATLIHRTSSRGEYPFLEVNCAALPEALLESELFGHEKGAFTDAVTQKMGLLELAHSGTLFLDEIGEMALTVQVKLLRVLEKMAFRRVGGTEEISVDVRLIAATNRNLLNQVKVGAFREDLYYRLKVVDLMVPPLRSRQMDIVPLAEYFLKVYSGTTGKNFVQIDSAAQKLLEDYQWPGNIRELRNVIERTVLLEEGPVLKVEHLKKLKIDEYTHDLPFRIQESLVNPLPDSGIDLENMVFELENALVQKAFTAAQGNQSQAARLLGLNRDKFRYRLKQYGIKE